MYHRREIFGWAMYDWANSAFYTTVVTTFFGPYLARLAEARGGTVEVFGIAIYGAAFYPLLFASSVIVQVLLLPILGAIADFSPLKKSFMLTFAYVGALCTVGLFWVDSQRIVFGGLLFSLANLCFGAALVFYNAFLPAIAAPNERDAVSSQGFACGYVGGGLLLLGNLLLVSVLADKGMAVRLSLASAGVWWLVFTFLFPQWRLQERQPISTLPPGKTYVGHGFTQLGHTLTELVRHYPRTLLFLLAFLLYNDGIQTVIVVATLFAASELRIDTGTQVQVVLMIQFVAVFGALAFHRLAACWGAKKAILLNLGLWTGLVLYAYAYLYTVAQFWVLGAIVAVILGGAQALSRSLFSHLIPRQREAAYFSLYEISDRGTAWVGKVVFGIAVQSTGSQRVALLALIVFFGLGMVLLWCTDIPRAIREAGNEVPAVV